MRGLLPRRGNCPWKIDTSTLSLHFPFLARHLCRLYKPNSFFGAVIPSSHLGNWRLRESVPHYQISVQNLCFVKLGFLLELGFLLLRGWSLWNSPFFYELAPPLAVAQEASEDLLLQKPRPNSFCGKLEHECFLLSSLPSSGQGKLWSMLRWLLS